MKALLPLFFAACLPSPLEALCSRGDVCSNDIDRRLEGIAIRDGAELHLIDGRRVTVRVLFGAKIQAFGDDVTNTAGLCGVWRPRERTITLAQAPGCGEIEDTLLHELGHAMGLRHAHTGVMANGYARPVTERELRELRAEIFIAYAKAMREDEKTTIGSNF